MSDMRPTGERHTDAVVVGLGDSRDGHQELDWAAREAQVRDRALHVVRAYHLTQATVPWETSIDRSFQRELRDAAEKQLDEALTYLGEKWPNVAASPFAVDGPPAEVLRAASEGAEVTVVGSRGRTAVGAALLGSVSTVVAAAGSGPVVVVGSPPGDPAEQPAVVAGVDGSPATGDVLDFAFDHASRHHVDLRVLFCWRPDLLAEMAWRMTPPPPERADRWLAEAVAGWQERYPDVTVHRSVVRDHPVTGLTGAAASQDLLVVGAHSRHARIAALLGSVSQGVLHHATCPVAVIHSRSAG